MNLREVIVITVVAVSVFMINLDVSITNIAMPTFNAYFKVGTGDTAKIVLAYLLSLSGFLLIFGKLSDEYGSKNIFIPGILIFKIASIFCAVSQTLFFLVISRFFQGIGGAMIAATYGAIVVQYLPAKISGKAFGLITAAGGAGFALGAPIGGYIIEKAGWHWIFIVNVPICLAAFITAVYVFRSGAAVICQAHAAGGNNSDAPAEEAISDKVPAACAGKVSGFDYPGALYCFIFLAAFVYAVNQGKIDGWLSPGILLSYLVFIIFLPLFILREKTASEPILDFSVLFDGNLIGCFIATIAVIMTLDGLSFFFPLFFETVKKMTPAETGRLLMIFPLLSLFLSPFAGHLCDKKGPALIARISLFFITVSACLFCLFNQTVSFLVVNLALVVFGAGLALFFPSVTALVMSHAPAGREGLATALYSSVTNIGSILGISVFEWLFAVSNSAGHSTYILSAADVSKGFNSVSLLSTLLCAAGFAAVITSRENKSPGKL